MTGRDGHDPGGPHAELDAQARRVQDALAAGERGVACEAYEAVVQRLHRRAVRVASWYLRETAEVDDAVQDAFLRAFEHMDRYRPDLPFEAWFLKVLVNGCLDRIKARSRRRRWLVSEADDLAATRADAAPTPEAGLLSAERRRALTSAIDRLPARQREVVVLGQLTGLSSAEIAAVTGLSESTVRVHLFRALRNLRDELAVPAREASDTASLRGARR